MENNQTKNKEEVIQEHYIKKLSSVTEYYSGVRINETLLGKILAIKKMSDVFDTNKEYLMLSKSLPRPKTYITDTNGQEKEVVFATTEEWLNYIHEEHKKVVNKLQEYKEQEQEYQEKLKEEKNAKLLEERRKFYIDYGLLPKVA